MKKKAVSIKKAAALGRHSRKVRSVNYATPRGGVRL